MTNIVDIIRTKKVILWDFDGCFCDSEPIHFEAYKKAFAQFKHTINEKEYYNTFTHTGGGIAKEIENYKLSCPPAEIRKLKNQFYHELIRSGKAQLFSQIPKIIQTLTKMGIKSVIASNSPKEEISEILSHIKDDLPISEIFGLLPDLRKKPHPDIFNYALDKLGIAPQDALVVEDSERGLTAAKSAHCQALWVKTYITERFETNEPHLAKLTHQEILDLLL